MLPSRKYALAGLDYEAADAEEYKAEQEEKKRLMNEPVKVEMYRMEAKRYTQVEVTYRGETAILCLRSELPSNNPDDIEISIKNFYKYVDLEKTAILKKAGSNDRTVAISAKVEKTYFSTRKDGDVKKLNGSRPCKSDTGLTLLGLEYNNGIYKERVIQIFAYAKKRLSDETIFPVGERERFSTNDVIEMFTPIYTDLSKVTIKNRVLSYLRYMNNNGWIKNVGTGAYRVALYKVIHNPFESEMPAQAEPIDIEYAQESKLRQLQMYREG